MRPKIYTCKSAFMAYLLAFFCSLGVSLGGELSEGEEGEVTGVPRLFVKQRGFRGTQPSEPFINE